MSRCLLHVTSHEYDRILQLNHDESAWSNTDATLFRRLRPLLGESVIEQLRRYDECRMQKHDRLTGLPRVEGGGSFPDGPFLLR